MQRADARLDSELAHPGAREGAGNPAANVDDIQVSGAAGY
jgi:hypothetical protein